MTDIMLKTATFAAVSLQLLVALTFIGVITAMTLVSFGMLPAPL